MPEDKGIVPNRRAYDTPVGPREMLGPYDVDFERLEMLERLLDRRDSALLEQDMPGAWKAVYDFTNLIAVEPFTFSEFNQLLPNQIGAWIDDFLADYEWSSPGAANRAPLGDMLLPANSVPHSNGTTNQVIL